MESMKALVKLRPDPGIWMHTVPFLSIGHNDVLIKIDDFQQAFDVMHSGRSGKIILDWE